MSLANKPLVMLIFYSGLYFTFRTGFVQLRMLREAVRVVFEKPKNVRHLSSFAALMISTASRVGTGNIIGVSTAICIGGPGSVFWMWITALIGGATAFVESTLAQIYKRKNPDGSCYGGPSFYIETVCRTRFLSIAFALALIFTYGVGYNMLASYNLQSSFQCFGFYQVCNCWITCFLGAATALLFLVTILGGGQRIAAASKFLVPFMGVIYVAMTVIVLIINFHNIPNMLLQIYRSAFNFKAIFGGISSSALILGVKRGLYSNEAGIGSAPNAAAAAITSHPVKQGLVQMLSVFIDTNLLCTATALMCLSSGVTPTVELSGAPYVQQSLQAALGYIGPVFIAIAMVLFAFTTLLGNFYYVESSFAYIWGRQPGKYSLLTIRLVGALLIIIGASLRAHIAWSIADITQAFLAFINIPVCIIIGGVAYKALKHYYGQLKAGVDPVFHASDIGLHHPTDFWQDEAHQMSTQSKLV